MQRHRQKTAIKACGTVQLIVFSAIGLVMFFVPFTIEKSTILFDHGATYLVTQQHTLSVTLLFLLMLYGVSKPFIDGSWRKNITHMIMTGLSHWSDIGGDVCFWRGTFLIMEADMLPFLFEKLALPVGMIVPIGALILAFLVGFGLLEMVGVLMQPIMKPIWKTPGSSAIDAVASFVGSPLSVCSLPIVCICKNSIQRVKPSLSPLAFRRYRPHLW